MKKLFTEFIKMQLDDDEHVETFLCEKGGIKNKFCVKKIGVNKCRFANVTSATTFKKSSPLISIALFFFQFVTFLF